MSSESRCESSLMIRQRTAQAREMQQQRYGRNFLNGTAPSPVLLEACALTPIQKQNFNEVCYRNKWSNRTQIKILRIARTIADLQQQEVLLEAHLQEAISWKQKASVEEGVHG